MRRGGKTDTIARQEEEGSGGKTVVRQLSRVERIREKRRALEFPGLDDDLRRTVSKVGGTIVKTEEHLPTGDKQTLTGDELNNMRESRNKHQYFSVS
jgi:hypothetical protein